MSKAVRIRDHLYEEIDRLAKVEKRSMISQLEILLEQALAMDSIDNQRLRIGPPTDEPREAITVPPDGTPADLHFKPDPK